MQRPGGWAFGPFWYRISPWRVGALSLVLITPVVRFKIWDFIVKMVHDPAAADGILTDAISRALERVEQDKPRNFIAWLYAIARNMAYHWIRDKKAYDRMLESRGERSTRSALSETITKEAFEIFDRELKRLTRKQRRALLLRVLDRMSCDEIAKKMRMPNGAVRALIFRAKLRLEGWVGYMKSL